MRKVLTALAILACSAVVQAQDHPADAVSQERLEADIHTLVGFGTRHTLSVQDHPTRGIGAAVRWGEATFKIISAQCGGCLEVVVPERIVQGRRIPEPTRLRNVVAIQWGTERPKEVVIVQGHIDSRVSDVMDFTSDAPGANDDGSGTVLVLEAARVLSQRQYPSTIVYVLLSGEEQGLYGGQLMADYAEEQGWTVKAVLNNDIVGGSCGSDGVCDDSNVRVFSEGPRADLTEALRADQRRNGGENDSPSRNLSRWLDGLADEFPDGLNVRQIWRTDRMGRGGDQIPFLDKGYPAIRFSVAIEDYEHQHQDLRVEDGVTYGDTAEEMDFTYLVRVTQLNVRALDRLARAPMPPVVKAQAAVRTDTLLEWEGVPGATLYEIFARRTDVPAWGSPIAISYVDGLKPASSGTSESTRNWSHVAKLRGDDWFFGVRACGPEHVCSPISSAVPAGAFAPIPQEEGDSK
ncbi:MAG: M20/M25/M40 family metallo-hydrolase [Sphingomonadaceae bacterium]|nr:M20/M25/M40 family metallo-hydrolase [Sphingomonadaceae bacterium]